MTDKIRAALEEYTQTPFMSAMGESLNQCCRTLASEGHADDCRGIEALREYDARATPALPQGDEYKHAKCPGHDAYAASQALPQGVEEWIGKNSKILTDHRDRYVTVIHAADLRDYLSGMAIVPVKPMPEMINAALPHAMRESDEDKYRAIGEIICIWYEMLAAAKEKGE